MYRVLSRIGLAVAALFVLGGLSFGASQAFGNGMVTSCGDDFGEIGTCPPLTMTTCPQACLNLQFFGGACLQGCCVCLV